MEWPQGLPRITQTRLRSWWDRWSSYISQAPPPFLRKTLQSKANWRVKGLFSLQVPITVHYWGKSGQKSRSRGKNHGRYLLRSLCLSSHSVSIFIPHRTTCLGAVPSPVDWTFQKQSVFKKMSPHMPPGQVWWRIYSVDVSSFQVIWVGAKLTKN